MSTGSNVGAVLGTLIDATMACTMELEPLYMNWQRQ